jgi:hypothetical protein
MNSKASISSVGAAGLALLLGCSTPKPAAPVPAASAESAEPALLVYEVYEIPPVRPWPDPQPFGGICKLGTSCLAMDPRPFEPCLLSTKHCSDKAAEPMLVAPPRNTPAPDVESRRVTTVVAPP